MEVVLADVEPGARSRPGGDTSKRARTITITVKAMPEGFLSTHLVGGVEPGTIVRLAAPQGNFVMSDPAPASVLFLTAGSGITPVMSMLRTLARRDQVGDVVHLHSAPTGIRRDIRDRIRRLAAAHDGYRLRVRATRTEGRLDLSRLAEEVPDWRDRQTWACGPEGMLTDAERLWSSAGHRRTAAPGAVRRVARRSAGAGGTVTFERSGKSATADAATSLMDAGERCRRADAVRLSDGDLPVVCGAAAGGPRPRPADRPEHEPGSGSRRVSSALRAIAYWTSRGFTDR